jgi:hypothetical protein
MVLVLAATFLFAAIPPVCTSLRRHHRHRAELALSVALTALALATLYTHQPTSAAAFAVVIACVEVGCPTWMLWMERHKYEIHGPWDEAVPKYNGKIINLP